MEFLGTDTDFSSHAELAAVGESGRSIGIYRSGANVIEK
jgi:hypothetical protein